MLGGWQLFSIITLASGHHETANTIWNTEGIESPQQNRPDLVPGQDPNSGPKTAAQWFNTAAFTSAAFHTGNNVNYLGRMGNAPVGDIVGPGMWDVDLGFGLSDRPKPIRSGTITRPSAPAVESCAGRDIPTSARRAASGSGRPTPSST